MCKCFKCYKTITNVISDTQGQWALGLILLYLTNKLFINCILQCKELNIALVSIQWVTAQLLHSLSRFSVHDMGISAPEFHKSDLRNAWWSSEFLCLCKSLYLLIEDALVWEFFGAGEWGLAFVSSNWFEVCHPIFNIENIAQVSEKYESH